MSHRALILYIFFLLFFFVLPRLEKCERRGDGQGRGGGKSGRKRKREGIGVHGEKGEEDVVSSEREMINHKKSGALTLLFPRQCCAFRWWRRATWPPSPSLRRERLGCSRRPHARRTPRTRPRDTPQPPRETSTPPPLPPPPPRRRPPPPPSTRRTACRIWRRPQPRPRTPSRSPRRRCSRTPRTASSRWSSSATTASTTSCSPTGGPTGSTKPTSR